MLANKFHIKRCHFLHYHSLVSAIPSEWKKLLFKNESSSMPALGSCILSKPLSCNILYQELLARQKLPPPTAEKRFGYYNLQRDDFSKIYLLPIKATKETKLIMFQYKIIHHILFTNSLLYKMKKVSSPHCPFCPAIHQTVTHHQSVTPSKLNISDEICQPPLSYQRNKCMYCRYRFKIFVVGKKKK